MLDQCYVLRNGHLPDPTYGHHKNLMRYVAHGGEDQSHAKVLYPHVVWCLPPPSENITKMIRPGYVYAKLRNHKE